MNTHTDNWENWFTANAPGVERFLYLIDESTNYAQTQNWASWINANPGPGKNLKAFATIGLPEAVANVSSLDISASWFAVADTTKWQTASDSAHAAGKNVYLYNGKRPAVGSFATEDDGVSLRSLAWSQFKKKVDRWFFWESTYYNDYQGGRGQTNVFQTAQTFGAATTYDTNNGQMGWNSSNGDGVLFYPGTDTVYPSDSYGVKGPMASLRLKSWRRGIQDIDYVNLAYAINPTRVTQIINALVPKVLWEVGIADPNDPSWQRTDIGWSTKPDEWEAARQELANIIDAAIDRGVSRVIALSTDKAANPVNLYGATKLASDKLFIAANNMAGGHRTTFSVVRYGNVVGSRGSVVPTFAKQIDLGGPVTITDPDMSRYFMSIGEAASLIVQAASFTHGGDVFLLDMADFEAMNAAYVEVMGAHRPARTVIGVAELPKPGVRLTMNLTAVTRA